jgi:aryl-alcohol dehydrogenase-like predicted oxidoreductase
MTTNRFQRVYSDMLSRGAPPLGFGCANLHGGRQTRQSLRLLAAALDTGIRYFDTARLYGHGQSEGLVGHAIRGRRDQVVIASKAGIMPTPNSLFRRAGDRLAHLARRVSPLRSLVSEPPLREPRFGVFAPAEVRSSLETSLRLLGTDYIDILLLHECEPQDARNPELVGLLEQLVAEGKIRAWGSAALPAQTLAIAERPPEGLSVLQAAHSAFAPLLPQVRSRTDLPFVSHSILSHTFAAFTQALASSADLARQVSETGVDPSDRSEIGVRLIAAALHDGGGGPVLFATQREDRFAQVLSAQSRPAGDVAALARLAHAWARAPS